LGVDGYAAFFQNSTRLFGSFDPHWEGMWRNLPDGAKIGYTAQVRIRNAGRSSRVRPCNSRRFSTRPSRLDQPSTASRTRLVLGRRLARDRGSAGTLRQARWHLDGDGVDKIAGLEVYRSVYFQIGSPGTPLSTDQTWLDAVAKLGNAAVPDDDLRAVIDLKTHSKLLGANLGAFNPQPTISKYYRTGQFNEGALGVEEC